MKGFARLNDGEGRKVLAIPGVEITEMWEGEWQCVIKRQRYRFVNQGKTPYLALASTIEDMVRFRDDMNKDLELLYHVRNECDEDTSNSPQDAG